MRVVDLESHFYSEEVIQALAARTEYPYYDDEKKIHYTPDFHATVRPVFYLQTDEAVQARLELMDAAGITTQVLGTSQGLEGLDTATSIECAIATNDMVFHLTQKYPDNFIGFGVFPVADIDAGIAEMERCKNELGFIGWMAESNFFTSYLDEPQFLPMLAAAERLKLPIYLHPSPPLISRLSGLGHAMAGGAMGFTVDTAITVVRMLFQGVFDQFPNLQVILGHLGEGLPYSLNRMDRLSRKQQAIINKNEHEPSYYFLNNIWLTTSGIFSNSTFECAKANVGIDRILFGSDYPFETMHEPVNFVKELPLSQSERAMVFYENFERLFSL